jgi:uncharacterized protein affecting Mg2+/Co2+ transport
MQVYGYACRVLAIVARAHYRRPHWMRGRSSGVEHNLAKVGVVGSNPIARSSFSFKYQSVVD